MFAISSHNMSGIYIHIPFCKQACHYCNFHFSTSLKYKSEMVDAIVREIKIRAEYLEDKNLKSIYFGGGTPSLLSVLELNKIFETLSKIYNWTSNTEITLEANPDDLSQDKISELKSTGINRLSIGIQSFNQNDLEYMNRAHTATEAEHCIKKAQDVGIQNITADLIYGAQSSSDKIWENNINTLLAFDIPHISAYCLTVEPGTALHHFVSTGKSKPVDEAKAMSQFDTLISMLNEQGYEHYEISNFAKQGHYAIHNTNYWLGSPYLGIGPSAHSYDGKSVRSWNIAHNPKYMKAISNLTLPIEHEKLTTVDQYNEMVLIRLRTKWGLNLQNITEQFPQFLDHFKKSIATHLQKGNITKQDGSYILTSKGKHFADRISMELFAG